MRGDITKTILKIIEAGPEFTGGIIDAFLDQRGHKRRQREILESKTNSKPDSTTKEKHRIRAVLSRLKKEGSLEVIDQGWKITPFGIKKLFKLTKRTDANLPSNKYESKKSRFVTIVTFDVPEDEKHLRQWLRLALINMGFIMLHRSVWMAKISLPKEFLEDTKELGIADYIQIISVDSKVSDPNVYKK